MSDKLSVPNPFLKRNGDLVNPYIDYQSLLDGNRVNETTKAFIENATGLKRQIVMPNGFIDGISDASVGKTAYDADGFLEGVTGYEGFNANADPSKLASLDVVTELPKLSPNQISDIITKHFGKSTVIKPSDAPGIYKAQQESGMSALAILGIGALESGYGTSAIAKQKNNLWGWNATNDNPAGNATTFSPVSQGALEFANNYLKTYYNNYGAKTINSAGTGNNPAGKGYAYFDNGTINAGWASSIGSIMGNFYNTAKATAATVSTNKGNKTTGKGERYIVPVGTSNYTISSGFGPRNINVPGASKYHKAIDISASYGVPVVAAKSGRVILSGWVKGYGNTVEIDHGNGEVTKYHHMAEPSKLKVGETIGQGESVGVVGSTGISSGNHLDFQIFINGQAMDPAKYISFK